MAAMSMGKRLAITAGLLAVFGGALVFALRGQETARIEQKQAAEVAATVVLKGLIALDVEGYFKDERVARRLADKRVPVSVVRVGSRDMAGKVVAGSTPDFFFSSGVVAANQIVEAARKANPAGDPERSVSIRRWSSPRGSRSPRSWSPTAWPRR
jgi:hypothetical protein